MSALEKKIYTIAVDFDGTIVKHCYPKIGEENEGATESLRKLRSEGHKLILWTVREGRLLEEAVAWCKERGVTFYAINRNYPEEIFQEGKTPRKLRDVDFFIDDRSIGGLPPWSTIYQMISEHRPLQLLYDSSSAVDNSLSEMMSQYQRGSKKRMTILSRFKKR